MAYTSAVPFDAMRESLYSVDAARTLFARTEPLSEAVFNTGQGIRVMYGDDWATGAADDPVPVWIDVPGGERYQLTRQGATQLGSTCRVNQRQQEFLPPHLMQEIVNWALSTGLGERELKLLSAGTGEAPDGSEVPLAVAQCRATISPFSNLRMLDIILERSRALFGSDTDAALIDFKTYHDLEQSICRVVLPAQQVVMERTGHDDDAWCAGVEFRNSLIGLKQTELNGYLFRFVCTNGMMDIEHSSGGFQRRGTTPEEAYAWAEEAVDSILGGLEDTFSAVQSLVDQPVEGFVVSDLGDLFREYAVPRRLRNVAMETMADTGGVLTSYDLVNAVTRVANLGDLPWRDVDRLLLMGGRLAHDSAGRCSQEIPCRRRLPKGWQPPPVAQEPAVTA
jgi:hypothetical protein